MKRLLIILIFGFGLMNKSFGQHYHDFNFASVGYIYSFTQKLDPMMGFNIAWLPLFQYRHESKSSLSRLELSWLHTQSAIPNNDTQKEIFNLQFCYGNGMTYYAGRNHLYFNVGISTGLVRLFNNVLQNAQTQSYDYSLRNKWYVGFPMRFDWVHIRNSWVNGGLFVYGNFHRYKDFGAGINLYFGKFRAN